MCGIVGAVSNRNIVPILVQGLARLEYRGYDSCGVPTRAGPHTAPRWFTTPIRTSATDPAQMR